VNSKRIDENWRELTRIGENLKRIRREFEEHWRELTRIDENWRELERIGEN